jgi:hypothetical protein
LRGFHEECRVCVKLSPRGCLVCPPTNIQLQAELEAAGDALKAREAAVKDSERALSATGTAQREQGAELERWEANVAQRERVRSCAGRQLAVWLGVDGCGGRGVLV